VRPYMRGKVDADHRIPAPAIKCRGLAALIALARQNEEGMEDQ